MYGSILVILGPESRTTPALNRGVELARRSGARLRLMQFVHHPMIDAARERIDEELAALAQREFLRKPREWLYAEGATLSERGLTVDCEVVWAPVPHEAMLGAVLDIQPDLVLKDADFDHGKPTHADRHNSDQRLIRLCPAPLMLVRPDSHLLPCSLLAAVDVLAVDRNAAAMNRAIIAAAQQLSKLCEATIDVASAYMAMPVGSEDLGAGFAAALEAVETAHATAFGSFCDEAHIGVNHRHRLLGAPAEAVNRCAEETQVDLVVVSAAYRSAWDRLLMGATAESLVRHLGCDILLIKPEGFMSELGRHVDIGKLRQRYQRLQEEMPA